MMTFSSKLLSEKLGVVRLTFYTAPISLSCLAPFMYWKEFGSLKVYMSSKFYSAIGIMIVGCINALMYNLVHAAVIKRT